VDRYFLTGLAMLEPSSLQFRVALPRRGEVATFLGHREGQQAVYIVMLILVFGSASSSR
jgi:hypothetical protein